MVEPNEASRQTPTTSQTRIDCVSWAVLVTVLLVLLLSFAQTVDRVTLPWDGWSLTRDATGSGAGLSFRNLTGQGQSGLVIAISALAIAALFIPLRESIQKAIDRRFYRGKYDAARTLSAFSAKMRDEVELDRLTEDLMRVINETMQPSYVALWLKQPPEDKTEQHASGQSSEPQRS